MNFDFYTLYYISLAILLSIIFILLLVIRAIEKELKKDRDEILLSLQSIDSSLKTLKKCVKENDRTWGENYYMITGSWNK